jgi:hypothetical protein
VGCDEEGGVGQEAAARGDGLHDPFTMLACAAREVAEAKRFATRPRCPNLCCPHRSHSLA